MAGDPGGHDDGDFVNHVFFAVIVGEVRGLMGNSRGASRRGCFGDEDTAASAGVDPAFVLEHFYGALDGEVGDAVLFSHFFEGDEFSTSGIIVSADIFTDFFVGGEVCQISFRSDRHGLNVCLNTSLYK